jgi:Icc-related predicted phosphoesterase
VQERSKTLVEPATKEQTWFFFTEPNEYATELLIDKKMSKNQSVNMLEVAAVKLDAADKKGVKEEISQIKKALTDRGMSKEEMLIEDFVDELLETPDISDDIQELGTQYQEYTIRARRVMQQKYKVLGSIMSTKQRAKVFCLPGNYDMDLKYTALHEHDLHLHWYNLEDLRICGYGGAAIWTPGIPERYVVHAKEK